jgi:hypothetical protein
VTWEDAGALLREWVPAPQRTRWIRRSARVGAATPNVGRTPAEG